MAAKTLFLLTLLAIISSTTALSDDPQPSVYDILEKYGLPRGLLPDSVKSYSLSADDGSFVVELEKSCYVQFDYLVYYDTKITGKLHVGSITDLDGIQVKKLLFWFDVDEIRVDLPSSDNIYFTVGIINKKLDIDQFETVHACKDNALVSCDQSSNHISQVYMYIYHISYTVGINSIDPLCHGASSLLLFMSNVSNAMLILYDLDIWVQVKSLIHCVIRFDAVTKSISRYKNPYFLNRTSKFST